MACRLDTLRASIAAPEQLGRADGVTVSAGPQAYANLTEFVIHQRSDALPDGDAAQAARHLVSVIEGLRWPVLFGVYSQQQAMDILDAQLDLIS